MPLILLGLLLLIGILGFAFIRYANDVQTDERPVRERYPHAFPVHTSEDGSGSGTAEEAREEPPIDAESYYDEDSIRGDIDHMIRNITEDLRDKARSINIDLDSIARKFGAGVSGGNDDPDNTVEFPKDNIENEKKKRGIHSD